jgi:acetolactate synthase-1/2/3 large subunit
MKASELFVAQLEEEGVRYVFGLPGEENLYLLDALRKSSIKVVITRHEQAAAFMAATYGRLTGKAGVCFSTLGPGATNLVTGVAHAQLIGAPLVSISAQKPRKENWQAKFQLVDVISMMKPLTKKAASIFDPNTIPTVLRNAFKTAEAERPGAVHLELPEDVAEEEGRGPKAGAGPPGHRPGRRTDRTSEEPAPRRFLGRQPKAGQSKPDGPGEPDRPVRGSYPDGQRGPPR